jgi:hypothetical protein
MRTCTSFTQEKAMARKFRTIRKLLRRSDYQDALVRYHAARRRGDSADAQRWLKIADMHLRVVDRFDEGVRRSMEHEAKLEVQRAAAARAAETQSQNGEPVSQLHQLVARMNADLEREGWD